MLLQVHSQALSKNQRIKVIVTERGDTALQMNISDARIVLGLLLEKEVNDELLVKYIERDSLNQNLVTISNQKMMGLQNSNDILNVIIDNLNKKSSNDEAMIKELRNEIRKKEKEIKKQRVLKTLGFIGCVILPVLTLLLSVGGN
jgi:hypothetical protein